MRILQHARQELPRLLATTIRHYGSVSFLTVGRHEPLVHLYQLVLEGGLQAGGKHRIIIFLVFTAQIFQVVFLFLLAVVPERVGTRLCNILHKPCAKKARSSLRRIIDARFVIHRLLRLHVNNWLNHVHVIETGPRARTNRVKLLLFSVHLRFLREGHLSLQELMVLVGDAGGAPTIIVRGGD